MFAIYRWLRDESNRAILALGGGALMGLITIGALIYPHPPAEAQISNSPPSGCGSQVGRDVGSNAKIITNCYLNPHSGDEPPVPQISGALTLRSGSSAVIGNGDFLFVVRDFKTVGTAGDAVNVVVDGLPMDMYLGQKTGVPIYNSECHIKLANIDMARKKASFITDCARKS